MSLSTFEDTTTALGSAALSGLLAQFAAAFKQTDRLLRLHTPLGADVLLPETFKAIETISGVSQTDRSDALAQIPAVGFLLQIDALSTNAHLELKALIGQPVLLELLTDQSRTQLRPFHGHVTQAECVGSNGGMARYRLTVEPWLAFLGAGRDSAVFQDQNVLQIIETVFTDYQSSLKGAGQLAPLWRLDVQDTSVYPIRSLTTQYQESDLQFVSRLALEEGLFMWFEHKGDAPSATRGSHTLVIADHNGAFKPHARSAIRFSQSKGTIEDDTIDQWRSQRQWHTHAVELASWDYRSLSNRRVGEHSGNVGQDASSSSASAYLPAGVPQLISQDTPGAYAYENTTQGQRLATQHLQALSVPARSLVACGSVRSLAPGSTFTLSGHATTGLASQPHAVLRILHHAKNNLSAQLNGHAQKLAQSLPKLAASPIDTCASSYGINSVIKAANASDTSEIFYRNVALVLPITVPYRGAGTDSHGQLIHPKPTVSGSQTALVIGVAGQHVTTDRDHRIKVQFAWQRGTSSQSRLAHPATDGHSGAPAEDGTSQTTGTWVRVATPLAPIAGANWGSVALPRIGQEVLITFLGGDIDRPVVVASLYNGKGQDNQQANQVAAGAANATGNAPSWFPGSQQASGKQGKQTTKLPGHAHTAVLSGIKTQALSTSQSGTGSYNQIVFDDTPGQSRLGLQSHSNQQGAPAGSSGNHSGSHELNLGALRQQTDNQRLGSTGYGFELKTHFSGAIRSGSGLLLTADKRQGNESGSSSHQMDSKEAQGQLQTGQELVKALTETAQQHKAMLPVGKNNEITANALAVTKALDQSLQLLASEANGFVVENCESNAQIQSEPSALVPDNCKWLSGWKQDWNVQGPADLYAKRFKRKYTISTNPSLVRFNTYGFDNPFSESRVQFSDGTFELIYEPIQPRVYKEMRPIDGLAESTNLFPLYVNYERFSVAQTADAIAQMSQLQLLTIKRFILAPNHAVGSLQGFYFPFNNDIVIEPRRQGETTDSELARLLMHEGNHALDDRWMGWSDKTLAASKINDQLQMSLHSKLTRKFATIKSLSSRISQLGRENARKPHSRTQLNSQIKKLDVELDKETDAMWQIVQQEKKLDIDAKRRIEDAQAALTEWKQAIRKDVWYVSEYSLDNAADDFAEHCSAYMLARGTPCEYLIYEQMPSRAAILDRYFGNKGPSKPKSTSIHLKTEQIKNLDKSAKGTSMVGSGGAGHTIAYAAPLMVMSAPAGIAFVTPQSASLNAGNTTSLSAGQDINLQAQANAGYSVKMGISLFTYGKASNPKKPNQEAGISLHAASGKVSSQSQSDKTQVTADKAITVASTTDAVSIQAPQHVLLTAQGAYIKMSGGNIEIHAPGKVDFKASMKSWTGGKSNSVVPPDFPQGKLPPNKLVIERLYHDKEPLVGAPFEAVFADGSVRKGVLDGAGRAVVDDAPAGAASVRFGPMPGAYAPKDKTPMPDHKPNPKQSDIEALLDKYAPPSDAKQPAAKKGDSV